MQDDRHPAPVNYKGVMVSSTFADLVKHRAALIKAIEGEELKSVAMENVSAKPDGDVVDSSLQMVQDASAYVGVISRKYGQIPECPERNPDGLSLTQLEFNEARRLGRPVLLFIMGDDHLVKASDVETDPEKIKKLEAFREDAKHPRSDSSVHRVYRTFNNLHEFGLAATQAIATLRRHLQDAAPPTRPGKGGPDPIPTPPAFYAEPPFIGMHDFVGRQAQLDMLNDWAAAADPHPILLFEAIGGAGKSMLTWEWTTGLAGSVRGDWAGRFWYSFYEKGAIMADFCGRALAYITGQPLEDFRKKKTAELGELLLHHLKARPWLLILDGLERVLVAYHRFDAAQLVDEEAGTTDQITDRDPCAAIRPEDDDLLRALTAAAPSKLLLTSRLIPRVLLNASSQPIPGVRLERLPGLRPADAEELFRACGVTGTSQTIRNYLKSHCDCHPLVTGVLAALVNDFLPDRGNFDAWVADPAGGGKLNLAELDLVQRRNHILLAALAALPEKSRRLLSTLALLSEAVDYPTLSALNPDRPPEPEEVEKPENPLGDIMWELIYDDQKKKKKAVQEYKNAVQRREQALQRWRNSPEFLAAAQKLENTVRDLEHRGLLQYDAKTKRYDLHPVVRGVAAGGLRQEEKDRYGQRVVDHFSGQPHSPYEEAETLEDVSNGLHVVRCLLQMDRHEQACRAYRGDLALALHFNLEAHVEVLSLLRPFFPQGWATLPGSLDVNSGGYLANNAANALQSAGEPKGALAAYSASLLADLRQADRRGMRTTLSNISEMLYSESRLAVHERCLLLALDLAALSSRGGAGLFMARLHRFGQLAAIGRWTDAEAMWQLLDPMGRDWQRATYRPGSAERWYAVFRFWQADLEEEHLACAEQLVREGKDRRTIRELHGLRGEWRLEQGQWAPAAESLHEAVRMAREVGQTDPTSETLLSLASFHLDQLSDPRHEAERLAKARKPFHRGIADLWLAMGDREQAKKHALAAYKFAWADGEPYVHRYELNKARALLEQLGAGIPNLPPYDPAKDEKLPWEDEVAAAIEKLRAEKEAEGSPEAGE